MLPAMQAIAQPRVTRLRAVLGGEAPAGGGSAAKEVADLLEELCALLRDVKPKATDVAAEASEPALGGAALQDMPHPSVQMLNDLWEVRPHPTPPRLLPVPCHCTRPMHARLNAHASHTHRTLLVHASCAPSQVFAAVFARHGTDTRCMERLCRCYKHTARNCGDGFAAMLPQLLPQVILPLPSPAPFGCFCPSP